MPALQVEIVPWGPDTSRARREAAAHGRVLSVTPLLPEDPDAEPDRVRATVYDYEQRRALLLDYPVDGGEPEVTETVKQPLPGDGEREAALAAVEADPELGAAVRERRLVPYRAMPPLVLDELPDGTVDRLVTVGLRPEDHGPGHEIVGVRLPDGEIVRYEGGAPPRALAARATCGPANANQSTTSDADGAALVTVSSGGERLWRFVAVRPAASSGTNGSGIELRAVYYKDTRVFRRAHVPILNVRYDGDACGPYRDWQNEEGHLQADGTDPAPGFRLCTAPATTVLDTGRDRGNFRGTAVYVDGEEVVLVNELEAGWYRYVSEWRFEADGTIRPRFGFGAVRSSCVCNVHHHHAYWRFDFDVNGAANDEVREYNDPALDGHSSKWHTLRHEIRRRRAVGHTRRWQVRDRGTGKGYTLIPGNGDGRLDSFGVGDFWALRYRSSQIDDGVGFTTDPSEARAHLDRFVNGESIVGRNVVVWYAAHFAHDVNADERRHGHGHIVGPRLEPVGL